MCELCVKHGAAGKWYLNARHYSEEVATRYNLRDFLMEQYRNFEQISVRKVKGFNPANLGYTLRVPMVGRVAKHMAERMLRREGLPEHPLTAEGHIGQVVPLEDGVEILQKCAVEPIIEKNCMCRYMSRGVKEACCIAFGVMSEIMEKLPRFVPEKDKFHLSRAEAVARYTEHNKRGYVGTIWFGPFPYINTLCSCDTPACAGLRPRVDFGIKSVYKSEYVIHFDAEQCTGCEACVSMCQFGALKFDKTLGRAVVDQQKCYGCGVCRHSCPAEAIFLVPRNDVPAVAHQY